MRIASLQKRDILYAQAIWPILTDERCKELAFIPNKKVCCLINGDRLLLVKTGKRTGKNEFSWTFAFQHEDREFLVQQSQTVKCILLFLICRNKKAPIVCAVKWNEAQNLLDCTDDRRQHNIYVKKKKNVAYQLTGPTKTEQPPRSVIWSRGELLNYFYTTSQK